MPRIPGESTTPSRLPSARLPALQLQGADRTPAGLRGFRQPGRRHKLPAGYAAPVTACLEPVECLLDVRQLGMLGRQPPDQPLATAGTGTRHDGIVARFIGHVVVGHGKQHDRVDLVPPHLLEPGPPPVVASRRVRRALRQGRGAPARGEDDTDPRSPRIGASSHDPQPTGPRCRPDARPMEPGWRLSRSRRTAARPRRNRCGRRCGRRRRPGRP